MTPVQAFRAKLLLAIDSACVKISQSGVHEFLSEIADSGLGVHEICVRALMHFCVDDGTFSGITWPLSAVLRFLSEQSARDCSVASAEALRAILQNDPTEAGLLAWARTHYPIS